jgi:hypothetical protein
LEEDFAALKLENRNRILKIKRIRKWLIMMLILELSNIRSNKKKKDKIKILLRVKIPLEIKTLMN